MDTIQKCYTCKNFISETSYVEMFLCGDDSTLSLKKMCAECDDNLLDLLISFDAEEPNEKGLHIRFSWADEKKKIKV